MSKDSAVARFDFWHRILQLSERGEGAEELSALFR